MRADDKTGTAWRSRRPKAEAILGAGRSCDRAGALGAGKAASPDLPVDCDGGSRYPVPVMFCS